MKTQLSQQHLTLTPYDKRHHLGTKERIPCRKTLNWRSWNPTKNTGVSGESSKQPRLRKRQHLPDHSHRYLALRTASPPVSFNHRPSPKTAAGNA